jgi:hypothetical protein
VVPSVAEYSVSRLPSRNFIIKIYKTIIFPVFYGCETWSLTFRKGHGLRVFRHGATRKIFPQRGRKLRNEGAHNHFSTPSIVIKARGVRWAGRVTHMEWNKIEHRRLGGKPDGRSMLARTRHRG